MVNSICKTFYYNNQPEFGLQNWNVPHYPLEVNLTYCDTKNLFGLFCNRVIETTYKENLSLSSSIEPLIYSKNSPFYIESSKMSFLEKIFATDTVGFYNSKEYHILKGFWSQRGSAHERISNYAEMKGGRRETFYTGCFDWDAAVDGDEHVRSLADNLYAFKVLKEKLKAAPKANTFKPSTSIPPAFLLISDKA